MLEQEFPLHASRLDGSRGVGHAGSLGVRNVALTLGSSDDCVNTHNLISLQSDGST